MTIRLTQLEAADIIAERMTKILGQQVTAGQVLFVEEYADKSGSGSANLSYIEVGVK